jgi:pyrimidine operon attenuation protein / uracil phosphoribosyltransferase
MLENQLILNNSQTNQKIKRIAFEIFENNYLEQEIILAGIYDKGYLLAQFLHKALENIAPNIHFKLIKIDLDKFAPLQSEIKLNCATNDLKNKVIVLVDDVLNSGRTLAYSLKPFLNLEIRKIQIAVLVDRGHKSFPVAADYIGYSLSTTLKEHVEVALADPENLGVYLK